MDGATFPGLRHFFVALDELTAAWAASLAAHSGDCCRAIAAGRLVSDDCRDQSDNGNDFNPHSAAAEPRTGTAPPL
jgi:hypothetical protein